MNLGEIEVALRSAKMNYKTRDAKSLAASLNALKQAAVAARDERAAKELWCLEQALSIQETYLSAVASMQAHQFYVGWCALGVCPSNRFSARPARSAFLE